MLNLLFISNSPKIQSVQEIMQPLIKAKIDVVSDFDHGLKDVFEKRPATVIIQEQISGVTGESVARHIQLLLGNGAPKFVLIHEGNTKLKPIPGLFGHVIDLNQPGRALVTEILSALKQICGEGWEKVVVERPPALPVQTPQKDLVPPLPAGEPAQPEARQETPDVFATVAGGEAGEPVRETEAVFKRELPPVPDLQAPLPGAKAALPPEPDKAMQAPGPPVVTQPVPSVKDFTVSGSATVHADMIPEDILRSFDENCRSRSRKSLLLIVLAVLGVCGTGAYLFRDHPRVQSLYRSLVPTAQQAQSEKGSADRAMVSAPPQVSPSPQQAVSSASKPSAVAVHPVPPFISVNSRDRDFSTRKPGWERYVDAQHDIRLFRQGDRIKAIQVIALPGQAITEGFMKTVLNDVAGSNVVSSGSQQQKQGYLILNSRVGQHADVQVYRAMDSKAILGLVVSLD